MGGRRGPVRAPLQLLLTYQLLPALRQLVVGFGLGQGVVLWEVAPLVTPALVAVALLQQQHAPRGGGVKACAAVGWGQRPCRRSWQCPMGRLLSWQHTGWMVDGRGRGGQEGESRAGRRPRLAVAAGPHLHVQSHVTVGVARAPIGRQLLQHDLLEIALGADHLPRPHSHGACRVGGCRTWMGGDRERLAAARALAHHPRRTLARCVSGWVPGTAAEPHLAAGRPASAGWLVGLAAGGWLAARGWLAAAGWLVGQSGGRCRCRQRRGLGCC